MGWLAITSQYKLLKEEDGITEENPGGGRPVDAGNNGELLAVGAQEYGHSVLIDLVDGVITIDFDSIGIQNGTIEVSNPRFVFSICEETSIVGEYKHRKTTKPDKTGNYTIIYDPMVFRPIWFNRIISTLPGAVVVVGAQTTTPSAQGRRNIKKIVSLFPDGRVGLS